MAENAEKDKEVHQMVNQFQVLQQQLQGVLIQKESMKMQQVEIDRALEELGKTKQESAYKITGAVMVSKPVKELQKELQDSKEVLDVRAQSLKKAEDRISGQLRDLQEKLKNFIK